jgi:hypothetical protein
MNQKCNAILIPVTGDALEHRYSNGDKADCFYLNEKDHDLSRHPIDENYLPHHLYITIDEKVKEGDWGVGYAQGFRGHGAGHFLFKNDGTNVGKLNAICTGVSKVVCSTNPQVHGLKLSPNSILGFIRKYISGKPFEVEYEERYNTGIVDCGDPDLWDSGYSDIVLSFD